MRIQTAFYFTLFYCIKIQKWSQIKTHHNVLSQIHRQNHPVVEHFSLTILTVKA